MSSAGCSCDQLVIDTTAAVARRQPRGVGGDAGAGARAALVRRVNDRLVPGEDPLVAGGQLARVQDLAVISRWLTRTSIRRPANTGSIE